MRNLWLATLGLAIALILLARPRAHSSELLQNGNFESGTDGWSVVTGVLEPIALPVHGGAGAARYSGGGSPSTQEVFQWVAVQPNSAYQFSGWVLLDDPDVQQVYLRVVWSDEDGISIGSHDSLAPLTGASPTYRFLTTGPIESPAAAAMARAGVRVLTNGDFSIYLDDISLEGVAVTPSPVPTPAPTLAPPTPAPSPTPIPTPTPAPTPSLTPTATPAVTALPTTSPTPTFTPSPRATPVPTPSSEATVFSALTNGGFEQLRPDGTPYAWRKVGGVLGASEAYRTGGARSLSLISETGSTKWAYQTVSAGGGSYYEAAVMAAVPDGGAEAFLRLSWYDSDDGSGEAIAIHDSPGLARGGFRRLSTGPVMAPAEARSVKIRLMLRPASASPVAAYFDDASFAPASAPSPTPPLVTPTSTPTPTPRPAPETTPGPSPATPTTAASATPEATPFPEPGAFPSLVNGGFEESREDGGPYGWQKVGGEIALTEEHRTEGHFSLRLSSQTTATKWAYQTVTVQPGAYYELDAFALKNDPNVTAAFLRISWYESEDGTGQALGSWDSAPLETDSPSFRLLSTGIVRAPDDARSAKVKLMLRPASSAAAAVFFDAVSFAETAATPSPPESSTPEPGPSATPSGADRGEPAVFAVLTNGGFEDVGQDGRPLGWRQQGGDITLVVEPRNEGDRALAFTSRTGSTKWVYQTVLVDPSGYYQAAAQAFAPGGGVKDVFLRVSWYESEDGSGEALGSSDSPPSLPSGGFETITTGRIQAPSEARSAKVRLMVRPASEAEATVYFDAAEFRAIDAPVLGPSAPAGGANPAPEVTVRAAPTVLGALFTPVALSNVQAPDAAPAGSITAGKGGNEALFVALAAGAPLLAVVVAGALRLRRPTGRGDSNGADGGGGVGQNPTGR